MSNERIASAESNARTMALEGKEAAQLYAMEIAYNMNQLRVQVGMLQAQIVESKRLLDEIHLGQTGQTADRSD